MKRLYAAIVGAGLATALTAASLHAQDDHYVSPWKTPWTYGGQAHWGDLDPDYKVCETGKAQSPIDIRKTTPAKLPPLRFAWVKAPLRYVINNRYTIRVNYPAGNGNYLFVGDKRYELIQFHFHAPSEDRMNGRKWPMETHFMYKAADGEVAGVTVFNRPGAANPAIQTLWDHMPMTEGQNSAGGVPFSPGALAPASIIRHYDEYIGSVTAPPCTEGVRWLILDDTMALSPRQIAAFTKLYPNDDRNLQPLNGRVVKRAE